MLELERLLCHLELRGRNHTHVSNSNKGNHRGFINPNLELGCGIPKDDVCVCANFDRAFRGLQPGVFGRGRACPFDNLAQLNFWVVFLALGP